MPLTASYDLLPYINSTLQPMQHHGRNLCCRAIAVGNRHSRFAELVARAGDRPSSSDAEKFSFWVANLIPLNPGDKYRLLSMTSSANRLKFEHDMLRGGVPGGCSIM